MRERDATRINISPWFVWCVDVTVFAQIRISGGREDLKGNFIGSVEIKFRAQMCKHRYLKCRGRASIEVCSNPMSNTELTSGQKSMEESGSASGGNITMNRERRHW